MELYKNIFKQGLIILNTEHHLCVFNPGSGKGKGMYFVY